MRKNVDEPAGVERVTTWSPVIGAATWATEAGYIILLHPWNAILKTDSHKYYDETK